MTELTSTFPRGRLPKQDERDRNDNKNTSFHNKKDLKHDKKRSDLLFGHDSDTKPKVKRSRKNSKDYNQSTITDDAIQQNVGITTNKSLLPIGGGCCVVKPKTRNGLCNSYIESLTFTKLSTGFKLLACVKEVHDDVCIFSLPNMWTGYMLRNNEKDPPLDECFIKMQYISVVIVKAVSEITPIGKNNYNNNNVNNKPRRRIQVTCDANKINPFNLNVPGLSVRGTIISIEEHGLLIDLGIKRRGFLPFKYIESEYYIEEENDDNNNEGKLKLTIHRILDFIVREKSTTGNIIPLKLPKNMSKEMKLINKPTIQELQPGTLIPTVIVESTDFKNGIAVTFGNNVYRGAIEYTHLGTYWVPNDIRQENTIWKDYYLKQHRSFSARIIAVDPRTKIIRLSALSHVLSLQSPTSLPLPPIGTIIRDCTVIRVDPLVGALLALPDDDDNDMNNLESTAVTNKLNEDEMYKKAKNVQAVFVHISKSMDVDNKGNTSDGKPPEAIFMKEFAPSTKHSVRIIGTTNYLEGIPSGATAPSILDAHVLTHADIIPGKVYKQVPISFQLDSGGILVDFGMGIRGIIPALHLFDQTTTTNEFRTRMRKVKYAVGSKVDVRVISVDPEFKKCTLTAKKTIVKADDDQIITSYDNIKIGQIAVGFVSDVDDRGLSITFFNDVFGRVTSRSLAAELGVEDHKKNYTRGDVVQCRVVALKNRTKRNNKWLDEDEMEIDDEDDDDENNTHHHRSYFRELTLSLQLDLSKAVDSSTKVSSHGIGEKVHIRAGGVLPLKSLRVVELHPGKDKPRGYVPGYAIVSIKSKYMVPETEAANLPPYLECKLPYDQLLDYFEEEDIQDVTSLDKVAEEMLKVGKKINRKGIILTDPEKSNAEYSSGIGSLAIVSIRPSLIKTAESMNNEDNNDDEEKIILPSYKTQYYTGMLVQGYVVEINPRHGAFIRFLDDMTGLVPKTKGGLLLRLFSTVVLKVIAVDDKVLPPKILLGLTPNLEQSDGRIFHSEKTTVNAPVKNGDVIKRALIKKVDFFRVYLNILDEKMSSKPVGNIDAWMYCTMTDAKNTRKVKDLANKKSDVLDESGEMKIRRCHPFFGLRENDILTDLTVVSSYSRNNGRSWSILLSNQAENSGSLIESSAELTQGNRISGIVTKTSSQEVFVQLSPDVYGKIPALELSEDANVLNSIPTHFAVGSKLNCVVLKTETPARKGSKSNNSKQKVPVLSLLLPEGSEGITKPKRGDLVTARINDHLPLASPTNLMLELRGGYVGNCCITELDEPDDWVTFPLGRKRESRIDNVEEGSNNHEISALDPLGEEESNKNRSNGNKRFAHGKFICCRVIANVPSKRMVDVSLRPSRIKGILDYDDVPKVGESVNAYVVRTTKKGCFLRVRYHIEGKTLLKELCDGFLPDPASSFPPGRLIIGKVKQIGEPSKHVRNIKKIVDLDMRESKLLDEVDDRVKFEDVEINSKYRGTITRIEDYGVFVRIDNSQLSGLAHKSECSDMYIKNLSDIYEIGDLVKVLVLKKDAEKKQLGFSLKASNFEDDEDSDSDSSVDDESVDDKNVAPTSGGMDIHSDDENFGSKLAKKVLQADQSASDDENSVKDEGDKGDDSDSSDDSSDSSDSDSDSDSDADGSTGKSDEEKRRSRALDTDVGFNWNNRPDKLNANESDDEDGSSEDEEEEDTAKESSHKSRKKQVQRRREEQEISKREAALADGTADENPETAGDFERLLAGSPNSSELWIKYMAFHLTLANIQAARDVANKAFERIEFRQEREKLNVWCALLTLELKYGTESSLQNTLDRACQHNNPKYVYLRYCEMLEKQVSSQHPELVKKTDEAYSLMCKKFRSKKKVWIANIDYLLRNGRHEEAHELSKKALLSLKPYKHLETMSKYAQLEFEYGSAERARTIFNGLLAKYPKRLDLFFVYTDKEIKHGEIGVARTLFSKVADTNDDTLKMKLSDKKMKLLFKKWFSFEEKHGDEETQEKVKDAARAFVENR